MSAVLWSLGGGIASAKLRPRATTTETAEMRSPVSRRTVRGLGKAFQAGQDALTTTVWTKRSAISASAGVDPQFGGAYANLAVVYMRRKQWGRLCDKLHKAEHLLPQGAGIRLNIGLAYYRQNEFLKAIPPFESVVHDQPDGPQPRHLLGLCYFFTERWAEAASTLEPLWAQESGS